MISGSEAPSARRLITPAQKSWTPPAKIVPSAFLWIALGTISAGEDCSECYPEEGGRAEHYAHYGAENGAEARDVQKLDKEHSPGGERTVIDIVAACYGRHWPRGVGAQQAVYQQSIEEIAPYENSE